MLALLACWLGCSACARDVERKEDDVVEPAATRAPATDVLEYELAPTSRIELDLTSRGRRALGHVELVRGRLWIDAEALERARADLTFDMTTIRVSGDPPTPSVQESRTLTEQSLDWLEVRRPEVLAAHPEHRYAHVTVLQVRSAGGASARSGQAVGATSPGAAARRTRLKASGELELHGVRLPYTASLVATFEWPDPSMAGPARHIELHAAEPVVIDWLGHDLVPRDGRGDVSSDALAEMRRQPPPSARVGLRWTAELAHTRTGLSPR